MLNLTENPNCSFFNIYINKTLTFYTISTNEDDMKRRF